MELPKQKSGPNLTGSSQPVKSPLERTKTLALGSVVHAQEHLYYILSKPRKNRTSIQLHKILLQLNNNPFFYKLAQRSDPDVLLSLWRTLYYERHEPGDYVINFGEIGKTFYIILEGSVGVQIPPASQEVGYRNSVILEEVTQLTAGQAFGEMALLHDIPRTASIVAKNVCHLAVLDKEDYQEILGVAQAELISARVKLLQDQPMFALWPYSKIVRLSQFFSNTNYIRNQVVYSEGDETKAVYVIVSGEFKLSKKLDIPQRKRLTLTKTKRKIIQAEVCVLGKGQIFGDHDIVKEGNRTTTCIWMSQTAEVLEMSKHDFLTRIYNQKNNSEYKDWAKIRRASRSQRILELEKIHSPDKQQTKTHDQNPDAKLQIITSPRILLSRDTPINLGPISDRLAPYHRAGRTWTSQEFSLGRNILNQHNNHPWSTRSTPKITYDRTSSKRTIKRVHDFINMAQEKLVRKFVAVDDLKFQKPELTAIKRRKIQLKANVKTMSKHNMFRRKASNKF